MARVYDTFSSEAFDELLRRYADFLKVPDNFFQPVVGKSLPPSKRVLALAATVNDREEVNGIFKTTSDKAVSQ